MSESREIRVARMQAWERAKGELNSMLCTYWDGSLDVDETHYRMMDDAIKAFVDKVESEGYQE